MTQEVREPDMEQRMVTVERDIAEIKASVNRIENHAIRLENRMWQMMGGTVALWITAILAIIFAPR